MGFQEEMRAAKRLRTSSNPNSDTVGNVTQSNSQQQLVHQGREEAIVAEGNKILEVNLCYCYCQACKINSSFMMGIIVHELYAQ